MRYGAVGAAALAGSSVLAACGGSSGGSSGAKSSAARLSPGPAGGGTPARGGTLTIGMLSGGASETVDVRKLILDTDIARVVNLYDPLFRPVPGGVAPALATSAEPNKDATVWTLKLRPDVTWHDGKPFTAEDVVYTIRTWGTKESGYQATASGLIDFRHVRALDRLTVRVPLLRPFAAFPQFTSWYTALVVQDGTTDFNRPVGTGPFRFGSFTPGTRSTFTANHDYWRGAPYISELVVNSSFTDPAAAVNALLSGQVDIAPKLPPALAKANAGSGRIVIGNSPGPSVDPIVMRVDAPPFDDARVVQAFKLAVDRQAIVTDVFDGYATVVNDAMGHTLQYWANIQPVHDPEKAKSLLKAAGKENLSLPLYTAETNVGQNETATLVSAHLKAIGVNAPVTLLPVSTFYTSASPGYATAARHLSTTYWGVCPAGLGPWYDIAFTPNGEYNESGWGRRSGQETLINAALGAIDPSAAETRWRAVQEQQINQGGYLLPACYNYLDGYSQHVRGVETNQAGNCGLYVFDKAWLAT